jgi:hypothetical protein
VGFGELVDGFEAEADAAPVVVGEGFGAAGVAEGGAEVRVLVEEGELGGEL